MIIKKKKKACFLFSEDILKMTFVPSCLLYLALLFCILVEAQSTVYSKTSSFVHLEMWWLVVPVIHSFQESADKKRFCTLERAIVYFEHLFL